MTKFNPIPFFSLSSGTSSFFVLFSTTIPLGLEVFLVLFSGLYNFIGLFYIQSIGSGNFIFKFLFYLFLLTTFGFLIVFLYWCLDKKVLNIKCYKIYIDSINDFFINHSNNLISRFRFYFLYFIILSLGGFIYYYFFSSFNFIYLLKFVGLTIFLYKVFYSYHTHFSLSNIYKLLHTNTNFLLLVVFSFIGSLFLNLLNLDLFTVIHCDSEDEDEDDSSDDNNNNNNNNNKNNNNNNNNNNKETGKGKEKEVFSVTEDPSKNKISFSIDKDTLLEGIKVVAREIGPHIGTGVGTGIGVVSAVNSLARVNLPPAQKAGLIALTAGGVAYATTKGAELAKGTRSNSIILESYASASASASADNNVINLVNSSNNNNNLPSSSRDVNLGSGSIESNLNSLLDANTSSSDTEEFISSTPNNDLNSPVTTESSLSDESFDSSSNNQLPSPDDTTSPDQSFIDSPFEDYDMSIPLLMMLQNLLALECVELLFIFLLILIIINNYFYGYYIKFLQKLILKIPHKYIPNILATWVNNGSLKKLLDINTKFNKILFVIILLILLLVKLLHFYYSSVVFIHIDDFIFVYNHIKNNKLLLLVIPLLGQNFKFKGIPITPLNLYQYYSLWSVLLSNWLCTTSDSLRWSSISPKFNPVLKAYRFVFMSHPSLVILGFVNTNLINWLQEFKELCSSVLEVFKNMYYVQIGLYFSILVFINLK